MTQNLFNGPVQNVELLPLAARTAITTSPTQSNTLYRGVALYLTITQSSGTGGLTPNIQYIDADSGNVVQAALGAAKTTVGTYLYLIYPCASMNVINGAALVSPLPANWAIKVAVGDSSSYTYSLSADLLI